MAKRPYDLDFSLESAGERLAAIEDVLDAFPGTPTHQDLETFANYILYAYRDEKLVLEKRNRTFRSKEELALSLESVMNLEQKVSPTRDIYLHPAPHIARPTYDRDGNLISAGDRDIPGMVQLWDSIDRLTHLYKVASGEEEDATVHPNTHPFYVFQLKHMLCDVRRDQFYLKDMFKPTLHFLNKRRPEPQTFNFDSDSFYWVSRETLEAKIAASYNPHTRRNPDEYETRTLPDGTIEYKWVVREQAFDWENYVHVRALMKNYSALYMQLYDAPLSWGRTLLYDFDRYVSLAHLGPVKEYIILRTVDGATNDQIIADIKEKFDIAYSENAFQKLKAVTIPTEIATAAKKVRVWQDFKEGKIKGRNCTVCGEFLPLHPYWFSANATRPNGFTERCRKCYALKYRAKKERGEAPNGSRDKDAHLREMPTNFTLP